MLDGTPNPLSFMPVFVNGSEGYACFRIPSIVRATNGDLLAFAEGRVESCSDSTSTIRAVCKRSRDNGQTWGAVQVVARNLIDGEENAVANISPVVDAASGRIVVLFNKAQVSEWLLAKGRGHSRICQVTSDDHGVTWSDAADISAQVHRSADDWRVQRPTLGHAIQLRHPARYGRLLHAGLFTQGDRSVFQSQNYIFTSDDVGATWQIRGVIPREGLNEATVVELEDGDILVNSRAYRDERSEGVRAVTRGRFSGDALTFEPTRLDTALVEPAVQASLLRYSWVDEPQFGNRSRILFSNPAHPQARLNLTVRLSYDEGQSWPVARVVDPGPSAYSDMVVQRDGRIGVLYERGNQGGIHYVSFPLAWLEG
jgi:sialidase-1